MANNIAYVRNYTSIIDEVHQRATVSTFLGSLYRMTSAGCSAKGLIILEIEVTGIGG